MPNIGKFEAGKIYSLNNLGLRSSRGRQQEAGFVASADIDVGDFCFGVRFLEVDPRLLEKAVKKPTTIVVWTRPFVDTARTKLVPGTKLAIPEVVATTSSLAAWNMLHRLRLNFLINPLMPKNAVTLPVLQPEVEKDFFEDVVTQEGYYETSNVDALVNFRTPALALFPADPAALRIGQAYLTLAR
jgi:hypothetical protein